VLEEILKKEITGNRFPYTKWDNDSFRVLKEAGYAYDSSVWAHQTADTAGIREFPIADSYDDWTFYEYQNKTDGAELYASIKEQISGDVFVIIHHPWVLAEGDRLSAFEQFIAENPDMDLSSLVKNH